MILLREQLPLAAPLHDAIAAARAHIEARRHQLLVSLPTRPIYVFVDRLRMTEVFLKIICNAVRQTPAGGHISVQAEKEQREITVRVRDNGSALVASAGLSTARDIIEQHGGRMEAHSNGAGLGSEFIIRLPLLPEEQAA